MNTRVFEPELYRVDVGDRRFATGDVNRIARRSERRDEFAECSIEVRRNRHQGQLVIDAGIRQQHARTARARDDDDIFALWRRQDRNAAREFQHVAQRTSADNA